MNYVKIYNELINHRKRNTPSGYVERHHIIPRSLNGLDDVSNIVALTAKEHFIAHLLLVKIHQYSENYFKMLNALMFMKAGNQGQRYTSRLYEVFKKEFSNEISKKQTGSGNNQYGSKWIHNQITGEISKTFGILPEGWAYGKPRRKYTKICRACSVEYKTENKKLTTCSIYCRKKLKARTDTLLGKEEDFLREYKNTKSINQSLKNIGSKSGGAGRHFHWAKSVLEKYKENVSNDEHW